jgi:putative transposase
VSHTYASLLYHVVFSTKERRPLIREDLQPRLWSYMGGIARTNAFKALAIGGIEDHVHLLLSLHQTMPIAKAVQLVKAGSSKWVRQDVGLGLFQWQENFAAYTIGISQVPRTERYINNQREHHKKISYAEELALFLRRHGIVPKD